MPLPLVKHGSKVTPRSRNKDGSIRKKRSDVGKTRRKCQGCADFFPLNNGCGKLLRQIDPEKGCEMWQSQTCTKGEHENGKA